MHRLKRGFEQFQREVYPRYEEKFRSLASSQQPPAMVITCADSRVLPSLFLQAEPGDLFLYRNIGNIVPPYDGTGSEIAAALEYAVDVLRVRDIVVCGHSDCGAMKAVMDPESVREHASVSRWLRRADRAKRISLQKAQGLSADALLRCVTEQNVLAQLDNLGTHPSAAAAMERGELSLHGWCYEIASGSLFCYDPAVNQFTEFRGEFPSAAPLQRLRLSHNAA